MCISCSRDDLIPNITQGLESGQGISITFTDFNRNCKLASNSLFCFYKLRDQMQGSCPTRDSKLAMNSFDLNKRESQAAHGSAGQLVWNDDRVCWGASSPVPSATPCPRKQQSSRKASCLGGISLCAHPISILPGLDLELVLQPSLTFLTRIWPLRWQDLISSQGLSTCLTWQWVEPAAPKSQGSTSPACSPFCLPPCHWQRSEVSSNTWQPFPVRAVKHVSVWPKVWSKKRAFPHKLEFYTITWPALFSFKIKHR